MANLDKSTFINKKQWKKERRQYRKEERSSKYKSVNDNAFLLEFNQDGEVVDVHVESDIAVHRRDGSDHRALAPDGREADVGPPDLLGEQVSGREINGRSLMPMLIAGLVLIAVGYVAVMIFV